jgi:hypothetical protein
MPLSAADFMAWHRANPQVYELFRKFALDIIRRGYRHYGAAAVMERIRWYLDVETVAPEGGRREPFKCNNDYRAFYARKFMEEYPEYMGFFRRRESVADTLYPPKDEKLAAAEREAAITRLEADADLG